KMPSESKGILTKKKISSLCIKGMHLEIRAQTRLTKTSSKPRNAMGGTFRETYERYVRNKMGNITND
ncbi:hypothetical protein, partial [Rhizobium tropici]|uniref:hypothetical protein n=1 Tax=Rhizobium tropici TaxID=398 RepID=UPI001A91DBFA